MKVVRRYEELAPTIVETPVNAMTISETAVRTRDSKLTLFGD